MTHYFRHWECGVCGKKCESVDWPKEQICDVCEGKRDREAVEVAVPSTPDEIREVCHEIGEFLAMKNEQYGDSALNPVRVFSKADADEQIRVRIDDKISRLVRGDDRIEDDEDIINDMIGYLVLWKVIQRRKNAS